jgi:CheY-like chemotaxis protein
MLNNQKFDLILMDLQMPGMDGYQTTTYIRNHMMNDIVNIPIVALTANAINGEKNRCLELGMNDYLSKPFQANQLNDVIAKILIEKNIAYKPPIYNLSFLRKLSSGQNDFIKSILEQFLNQTPSLISEINEGMKRSDWEKIAKATHKIKPSLEYIGATDLKEMTIKIEALLKTEDQDSNLLQLIKNLTDSCNIIYMELEKELINLNTNNQNPLL